MKFGGNSYDTHFINVSEEMEWKKPINFHNIAVEVIFSQTAEIPRYIKMQAKKGIDIFRKREVAELLKEYIKIH